MWLNINNSNLDSDNHNTIWGIKLNPPQFEVAPKDRELIDKAPGSLNSIWFKGIFPRLYKITTQCGKVIKAIISVE